jgi:hypothetical protein
LVPELYGPIYKGVFCYICPLFSIPNFLAQPNSFLAISSQSPSIAISLSSLLQLPTPELDSVLCCQIHILAGWGLETQQTLLLTTLHGPNRKHSLSIAGNVCLQSRCIATKVTQLLLA